MPFSGGHHLPRSLVHFSLKPTSISLIITWCSFFVHRIYKRKSRHRVFFLTIIDELVSVSQNNLKIAILLVTIEPSPFRLSMSNLFVRVVSQCFAWVSFSFSEGLHVTYLPSPISRNCLLYVAAIILIM